MKHILVVLCAACLLGCGAGKSDQASTDEIDEKIQTSEQATTPVTEASANGALAVLAFEQTEHDFGDVKEGEKVFHTFTFQNTGTAPLLIQSTKPSCGCTTPDWTKDPVPPGATGFVKVEFNSTGRVGMNSKSVSVVANTQPSTIQLKFKANVTKAE